MPQKKKNNQKKKTPYNSYSELGGPVTASVASHIEEISSNLTLSYVNNLTLTERS